MFSRSTIAAAVLALAVATGLSSVSVSASLISGVSTDCSTAIASFLLGDLGNCLSLTSLVSVVSESSTTSIISPLDSYLSTICSASQCSNATLTSALSTISTDCATDLADGTEVAVLLYDIVANYDVEYEVACLEYTANSTRCLTQTLTSIQTAIGESITLDYFTSFLSGSNSTQVTQLEDLGGSVWCTDCVKAIYDVVYAANKSIATTGIAKTLTADCGSSFTNGSYPSDVSDPLTSTTTSSATGSSTATSTTKSSGAISTFGFSLSGVLGIGAVVVMAVVGAGAVLI